jgi:hypothetical protein
MSISLDLDVLLVLYLLTHGKACGHLIHNSARSLITIMHAALIRALPVPPKCPRFVHGPSDVDEERVHLQSFSYSTSGLAIRWHSLSFPGCKHVLYLLHLLYTLTTPSPKESAVGLGFKDLFVIRNSNLQVVECDMLLSVIHQISHSTLCLVVSLACHDKLAFLQQQPFAVYKSYKITLAQRIFCQ